MISDMSKTVGDRLQEARKDRGLARDEVAERLGMSLSAVQAHENGRNQLKPEGLEAYARIYGVSIEWLVTGRPAPTAEIVDISSRIPDSREREAWVNMGKALTDKKG